MSKKISLLAVILVCTSGQVCRVNVNPVTGTPLDEANALIIISRASTSNQAHVEATITRGFAGVELDNGQKVEVNEIELAGTRRDFEATIDGSEVYLIAVTDPRRGTDVTDISEPTEFNITSPIEEGDASLAGFSIEWSDADAALEVEVELSQELLGEDLSLKLGPVTDDGELGVTSRQLADAGFGQGEPLTITVTKIRRIENVAGFGDGEAEVRISASIEANPTP